MHLRLWQLPALILTNTLLFSACGGADPAATETLSRMHSRMMERVRQNAITIEQPLIALTTSALTLNIFPADTSFPGTVDLSLDTSLRSDATNPTDPRADLSLSLKARGKFPSDAPKASGSSTSDQVKIAAIINARSVGQSLAVNVAKLDATAPQILPAPLTLPEPLAQRWYGKSFAEIDVLLSNRAKDQKRPRPPPVEQILTSALRGISITAPEIEKLGKNTHLWQGIRVLPGREDQGLIQIEVESDKKKIRDSVRALLTFLERASGTSFQAQMRTNEELRTMIESLTKNDAEFMRTMGSVKGILSADKNTYDFREFDGDIFDEKGVKTGKLYIRHDAKGDMSITITNLKENAALQFTKTGTALSLESNKKIVLSGTVSTSRVDLTAWNVATGDMVGSAAFDIKRFTKEKIELARGVFVFKEKNLTVSMPTFSLTLANSFKDFILKLNLDGKIDRKQFFTADFQSTRSAAAPFILEKPLFQPFEDLSKDFLEAFMSPGPGITQ